MHDQATLRTACETLAAQDEALARAYDHIGVPAWRTEPPCFQSIARTVTYQLLSTTAAGAIWQRMLDWAGGSFDVETVLTGDPETLRACGLSRPKLSHLTSIAEAIQSGDLPLDALHILSDAEAHKALVAIKGIGPWTANIYLMSSLGRLDVFPHGDVGLMESHRLLSKADERLNAKAFQQLSETWRPYRAVAAHLLWGYLNALRKAGN